MQKRQKAQGFEGVFFVYSKGCLSKCGKTEKGVNIG